jgi:hypothetical protein
VPTKSLPLSNQSDKNMKSYSLLILGIYASIIFAASSPRPETQSYDGVCSLSPRPQCAGSSKIYNEDPSLGNITTKNWERCSEDADAYLKQADDVLGPADAIVSHLIIKGRGLSVSASLT